MMQEEEEPTSKTHCDKAKQAAFSCKLWDEVVANGAPAEALEGFLQRMTNAMHDYELVFLANVATSLRQHVQDTSTNNEELVDIWGNFANTKMKAPTTKENAASVAVAVVVLSALACTHRTAEAVQYLESMSSAIVEKLVRGPFPQPHSPVAIVAMALGLSSLDDARNSTSQSQSENGTILCQFALLRLVNLPLLSPRLKPYDDGAILEYQVEVHRRRKVLTLDPSHAGLEECSLRMVETCIEEMVGFFQSSLDVYIALMEAVQSVLPAELFRPKLLNQLRSSTSLTAHDKSLTSSASEIVAFLKQFYGGVAPILEALSSRHLIRVFLALSRIEFAREVCASPTTNASMQAVTQQLEQALEQSATPPDTIFAPMLRSLAMHSMTANLDIPPELNIIAGCQALAVGLVMQRKLRILLFQCTPLVDDGLAVVFSVLYNIFEPVDAFAHRFLSVCLTHLAQFTPLFTVFPHYLQVTLKAYPTNASRQALTKACGTIFGSLFYSEALTTSTEPEVVETAQRMVLWAMRKCCERSTELLAEEDLETAAIPAVISTETTQDKTGERNASETDGLYLAGLVFELVKITPLDILKACAMESERLVACWKDNSCVLRLLKSALFARISQNCEAEKRAWLAAWFIELDRQYPVGKAASQSVAASRL